MKKIVLLIGLLSTFNNLVIAQTCNYDHVKSSHQTEQYIDNGDGTITDVINELVWSKCSLGQIYKDSSCSGDPESYDTWSDALLAAKDNNNYVTKTDDWRLPNIKELGTLVERACTAPAINITMFPTTPSRPYWSNTLDDINININTKGLVIIFENGSEKIKNIEKVRHVRLVRSLSETN